MKYLSLFSGVGGFELGIQQAYEALCDADRSENIGSKEDTERNKGQRLQSSEREDVSAKERPVSERSTDLTHERPLCIGYSEIDKYAIKTYQHHFPNHKNYGDITKINTTSLPGFDLIVGGFPCQAFSIAGKRGGFDDTRGTLFFEIARIVREKQPRLLLFENVKGLLSHDKGNTFLTIITALDELWYDCQWQVLNAKDFGVPQNRERVFIIGHLRGTPRPKVFPIGETNEEDTRNVVEDLSYTIDANYHKETNRLDKGRRQLIQLNTPKHSNDRVYGIDGVSPTLNTMQGGRRQPFIQQRPRGNNNGGRHAIAPTMTGQAYKDNNHVNAIRRLTPLECERLMGFPDNWTNVEGMSDTQRYKQCGNAVVTNVVQAIMEKLLQ